MCPRCGIYFGWKAETTRGWNLTALEVPFSSKLLPECDYWVMASNSHYGPNIGTFHSDCAVPYYLRNGKSTEWYLKTISDHRCNAARSPEWPFAPHARGAVTGLTLTPYSFSNQMCFGYNRHCWGVVLKLTKWSLCMLRRLCVRACVTKCSLRVSQSTLKVQYFNSTLKRHVRDISNFRFKQIFKEHLEENILQVWTESFI